MPLDGFHRPSSTTPRVQSQLEKMAESHSDQRKRMRAHTARKITTDALQTDQAEKEMAELQRLTLVKNKNKLKNRLNLFLKKSKE